MAHGKDQHPGKHKAIITNQLFESVQRQLKRSKAQRHSQGSSYRTYLLKGLVRCVWCGLPIWAETLWHGGSYYRERKMTRAEGGCVNEGKMVRTEVLDRQMDAIVTSIRLSPSWERHMAGIIDTMDKRAQIETERRGVEERLRRLGKTFVDGLIDESDYDFRQRILRSQLDGLVIPEERSTMQAGHLLENLPLLWNRAQPAERHTILRGFLECVYADVADPPRIVGIKPKPQCTGLFPFLESHVTGPIQADEGSEPDKASEPELTGWWRRGRLHLHGNHYLPGEQWGGVPVILGEEIQR